MKQMLEENKNPHTETNGSDIYPECLWPEYWVWF